MKIYISGAITGLPIDQAKENFKAVERLLTARGIKFCNPMVDIVYNITWTWEQYMKADIIHLMNCDGIIMMPNWMSSRGAQIEHRLAKDLGMSIEYIQDA